MLYADINLWHDDISYAENHDIIYRKDFMKVLALIFLILISNPISGRCDTDSSSRLIEQYISALKSRNEPEILSYWKAISEDPATLQIMERDYPRAFDSWRIKGYEILLAQKLMEYQEAYAATGTIPGEEGLSTPTFAPAGPLDNRQTALLQPNQDQPTLREVWLRSIQAIILDNGAVAFRYPNQDQPSNQYIIGNRLKALLLRQPQP